ncbi:MAG: HipA domain-containing protein [Coriobacteriia bacterium]|nr:HipA domain-containing protein [Coriobacteriia bacterium]
MIELTDFNELERVPLAYGGNAGRKIAVRDREGRPWMVKFPEPTRGMRGNIASYTTSPISEWLGSHIYGLAGLPVHETALGICEGKLVCACRDFTYPDLRLYEFHDVKNSISDEDPGYEGRPSDGSNLFLSDVLAAVQGLTRPYSSLPCLERFWDMFVMDGLIGNADRNNGNWGFLFRGLDLVGLAPVYDNGNAFFNKRRDSTMAQRAQDDAMLEQDAVGASLSCYKDQAGHRISPMRYIADGVDSGCMRACARLLERLDPAEVDELIDSLPERAVGLEIMPDEVKEFHKQVLRRRRDEVILPAYETWHRAHRLFVGDPGLALGASGSAEFSRSAGHEAPCVDEDDALGHDVVALPGNGKTEDRSEI